MLPGGPGKAPEEILRQGQAAGLPHPNLPGDVPQRRQLGGARPQDAPELGPGDRRGSLPGRGTQRPPAAENQTTHLLRRPDVPHRGRQGAGDHIGARALRDRAEVPQEQAHRAAR